MAESGKSDRWNSLLETLGVPASEPKAPPAAEAAKEESTTPPAKPQPVSFLRPEKPKTAAKPKPAKPAAKSPSYWSRIAGALGLEVAPAPAEEVQSSGPAARGEDAIERESVTEARHADRTEQEEGGQRRGRHERAERPRLREQPVRDEGRFGRREEGAAEREQELPPRAFERPTRGGRPERSDSSRREREQPSREEPPRQRLDDMFGPKEPDMDVFGLRGGDEHRHERPADESGPVLDYEGPPESGLDLPLSEAEEGERSGDEVGEQEGRRRRRRRRGRGRRGAGESHGESVGPRHEEDIEPAGEEADFDFERDVEMDLDGELRHDPSTPRQRGQRGGRRGREDDEAERYPPSGERQEDEPEFGERGDRDGSPRGGRGRGRRGDGRREGQGGGTRPPTERSRTERGARPPRSEEARPQRQETQGPGFEADMDDDEEGAGTGAPTHRKIPTWEEAVNILIDANMAARANSPDRDRDRGRGRGRGRR